MNMKASDLIAPKKQGAGCLLFIPESKKFLLIQRSDYVPLPGVWCLPGGGVEPDEDPKDAACREMYEETKIDVSDIPLHLLYTNEVNLPAFKFYTYCALIKREVEPTLNWESSDYIWCTVDDHPENIHFGLKQLLDNEVAAKKLYSLIDHQNNG